MAAAEKKVKLYVGCSLTKADEAFKDSVEQLKTALRVAGYEVFDFVGLVNGTPKDVYEWDIQHCVATCDAFVGICDEPSIGLGYELCEATRLGKPVLAVAHADSKVTRLVHGAAEVEANVNFSTYEDLVRDVPPLVGKLLSTSKMVE
ncbi:MAG TPA: hypothetical protein VLH86_00125 [Patescibacteria group bacterium]|nr:hypothetical protein [Patescibacteria group bacterium]